MWTQIFGHGTNEKVTDGDTVGEFDAWQGYKAQITLHIIAFYEAQNGSKLEDLLEALYDINPCSTTDLNAKLIAILTRALSETDPNTIRLWVEILTSVYDFVDSGTQCQDAEPLGRPGLGGSLL